MTEQTAIGLNDLITEAERRGLQIPDGIPIGQGPAAPCRHDFVFLRTYRPGKTPIERANEIDRDVFYCRHCLEYREVKRP